MKTDGTALRKDVLALLLMLSIDLYFSYFSLWSATTLVVSLLTVLLLMQIVVAFVSNDRAHVPQVYACGYTAVSLEGRDLLVGRCWNLSSFRRSYWYMAHSTSRIHVIMGNH